VTAAAVLCLIFGLCCGGIGALTTALPMLAKDMMTKAFESSKPQMAAQKRQLEDMRSRTSDPETAERLDNQIAGIDKMLKTDFSQIFDAMLPESVLSCMVFDGMLTFALYTMIFIAGCGMFNCNPWARKLAIFAAIGRLLLAVVAFILLFTVVMPEMTAGLQKLEQMFGQAAKPGQMAKTISDAKTKSVMSIIFSCLWPATLLFLLNTRSAKDAFGAGGDSSSSSGSSGGETHGRVTLVPK
jgi:hypothetical protein